MIGRFTPRCDTSPFAQGAAVSSSRARFWAEVSGLAAQLPDAPAMLNLCEDRYHFSLALLAALQRGQQCLLPPSRQPAALENILRDHPGSYAANDVELPELPAVTFPVLRPSAVPEIQGPDLSMARSAIVAFTSGSTGHPKACPHSLDTFASSARMALSALGLAEETALIVSTTRAQHMFGLETSVFWPLFSSLVQHPGRPFFPEEIRQTVLAADMPCLLTTTPTHLSALVRSGGEWDKLRAVICSTAFLHGDLAREAEALLGAPVFELYGSTETLSIAWRRTAREEAWSPYPGVRLSPGAGGTVHLSAAHLAERRALEDRLQPLGDGRFRWLGRASDLVKIGGKRGSLSELNACLRRAEGVRDGAFHPYRDEHGETRLAAVIVGEVERAALLAALRPHCDEVFLPRRIHRVGALPRNEAGKVLQEEWTRLLSELGYT